jgi:hypothetical protein
VGTKDGYYGHWTDGGDSATEPEPEKEQESEED